MVKTLKLAWKEAREAWCKRWRLDWSVRKLNKENAKLTKDFEDHSIILHTEQPVRQKKNV
jgi:hypothetical protein